MPQAANSLSLYRERMKLLRLEQRKVVEDMVQLLMEARMDGHDFGDVMDSQVASPEAPKFDL